MLCCMPEGRAGELGEEVRRLLGPERAAVAVVRPPPLALARAQAAPGYPDGTTGTAGSARTRKHVTGCQRPLHATCRGCGCGSAPRSPEARTDLAPRADAARCVARLGRSRPGAPAAG